MALTQFNLHYHIAKTVTSPDELVTVLCIVTSVLQRIDLVGGKAGYLRNVVYGIAFLLHLPGVFHILQHIYYPFKGVPTVVRLLREQWQLQVDEPYLGRR